MVGAAALITLVFQGCTGISIQPSCPRELQVGGSGRVAANEVNPGAIATYRWEAIPAEAGRFDNPAAASTMFQALREGAVQLRLTASDGLYQVISSCTTEIRGSTAVAVALSANPAQPMTSQTVTLTCLSLGQTAVTSFVIEQIEGPRIRLTETSPGVVTLVPLIAGSPRFQCIGESSIGEMSAPSFLTLAVTLASTDNTNENQNNNDNENGNDNGNMNDNGGGRR